MKTMKRFLSVLLALSMVISMMVIPAAAEGTPNVSFTVDETTVKEGETVTVVIENSQYEVNGFGCYLEFDKDLLECTSVTGADGDDYFFGMYYTAGEKTRYVEALVADTVEEVNSDGIFSFGGGTKNNTLYDAGIVATLVFTAKKAGTVEFKLTEDSSGTDAYKGEAQTETVKINKAPITEVTVSGLVEPETNAEPVEASELDVDPDSLNVKLKWFVGENTETEFVGEKFAPSTVYTAKITLEVKDGSGDNFADTVTVKGDDYDTVTRESAEKVVLTKTFPETDALPVPTADLFVMTIPAGLDLEYNGEDKWVEVKVADGVEGMGEITAIKYEGKDTGKVEAGELPTDSDTYIVSIDVAQGDEYAAINDLVINDGSDKETRFRIKKRNADLKWTEDANLVYDGTSKGVTVAIENLAEEDVVNVTVENAKNVDAGTYTAVATGLTGESAHNYRLPEDENKQPVKEKVEYTYTITKANAPDGITGSIIVSTKGVTERAYAVSELNLKLPVGFEFKNPQITEAYAVTEGDYGSVVYGASAGAGKMILSTSPVDPESEDLVVVEISSDNHNPVQIEVNVTAKAVDVEPALAGVEFVASAEYGTTIEKLIKKLPVGTVNAKDGEGKDLPGTLSVVNPTDIPDVGTATVYVRFTVSDTSSPYYAVVDTPYSVTITQKPLAVTWTDTKLTYNGEAQNPTVTVAPLADDEVTVSVTSAGEINAGSYEATADISGADAANYTLTDATKAFEIAPKALTITLDKTELPYNGKEQAPTVTASGVVSGDDVNVTVDKKTAVGTHNVTAVCDNANYTISNASQSYKITALDVALGLTKTSSSATMSEVDAWTLSNLPTTLSINGTTFDGAPTTVDITDWKAEGYSGNDVLGYLKGLDASDSDKVVKLTPVYTAESWMNVTGVDTYTLTITSKYPVDVTLTASGLDGIVYGTAYTPVLDAEAANPAAGDEFTYTYTGTTADGKAYNSTTAPTEAGSYTVTAALVSDIYTGSDSKSFTIAPKEVAAVWANTELTYNGETQAPTATATGVNGETLTLTVSGGQKNKGNYNATAAVSAVTGGNANAKNYTLTNATSAYEIKPAALTLDTIANVVLVGSNDSYTIAPKANGLFGSDKATFAYEVTGDAVTKSNNVIKAAANGQATITVTATNDNYVTATTTFKASAVVNPFAAIEVEGGAVTAIVEGNKIVATGTTTNIAGLIYNFTMATVDGAEIGAAVQNGKTVTVPVSGKTMTYTIDTKGITEVQVEIEYDKHNQIGSDGTISGMSDNLSSAAVQDIAKAAKDKNLDKVTVDVTTEVKTDSDGNISIDASYSVQGHEDIKGEITSTSKPVTVEVSTEADEGEQVFVKTTTAKGAASYKTVTVAAGKVVPFETKDFTNTYKVIVPETITVKFSYESDEPGNATETYNVGNIGDPLPVDEKSGFIFMGWDINGKAYKTVSEILWDIDLSEPLTAIFEEEGSDSDPTYIIKMNVTGDGSIKVNTRTPEADEEIVITVNPDKDCYLEELTVIDADGDELDLDKKGSKYYFDMPARTVTIKAVFSEGEKETGFSDVAENAYYFDAVEWAVEEEITTGYANGTFLPNATCTRAQTVTFLWRAMGEPKVKNAEMPFTDVAPDAYYYDAVLWAVENGITSGVSETSFAPNKTVTRAQTVTFLWRTAKMEGYDVSIGEETNILSYNDAETIGSYAIPAMQWACGEGIMGGYSDGTLRPNAGCTRAQIVTFLYRFLAD